MKWIRIIEPTAAAATYIAPRKSAVYEVSAFSRIELRRQLRAGFDGVTGRFVETRHFAHFIK